MTLHNIHYRKFWIGPGGGSLLVLAAPACLPQDRAFLAPDDGLLRSAETLDLGPVAFDQQALGSVTIQNGGPSPRRVLAMLDDPSGSFALPVGSWSLEPGQAVLVELSFSPTTLGPVPGSLSFVADDLPDAPALVALTGLVDPDGDDDGAFHALAGGDDCDDQDASRHPDAEDVPDGQDQDCDAVIDEDAGDGAVTITELRAFSSSTLDTSAHYIELYMNVSARMEGWELRSSWQAGTLRMDEMAGPGWVLLCDEAAAAGCDATVSPWPTPSNLQDELRLVAGERAIDQVAWDKKWAVPVEGLQVDATLAGDAVANDDPLAWCAEEPTPGAGNLSCP
jgi:hypothetical protein